MKITKDRTSKSRGFTIVELIVIVFIIGILVSIAVPVFASIQRKAKLNKSLQQAKQISLGLRVYAADNDGLYPVGMNANEALAEIIDYLETEKIFYVAGSAWHGKGRFSLGPDNMWETSEPKQGKALEAGENHYAYAVGYTDATSARFPLLASGFTKDQVGVYTNNKFAHGGVWEGKNCVVIYCDGSGLAPKLDRQTFKLINETGVDVFTQKGVKMLNPLPE